MPAPARNPRTTPARAAIALGGNVGDVRASFAIALHRLARTPGLRLLAVSSLYRTRPVGPVPQGDYLNAAAELDCDLPAPALLQALQGVERALGRDRAHEQRWGPRTLDLDLLLFGDERLDLPGLTVPHPRLAQRRFVLAPLADLNPARTVPGLGRSAAQLLADLPDDGGVVLEERGGAWATPPARPPA